MASAWLRRMSARSATERPSVPDHVFGDRRFGDLAAGGHNRDPYSRRPWIVPVHQGSSRAPDRAEWPASYLVLDNDGAPTGRLSKIGSGLWIWDRPGPSEFK